MSVRPQSVRVSRFGYPTLDHSHTSEWDDWAVTAYQGATQISLTSVSARYAVNGSTIFANASFTLNTNGSSGQPIVFSLPVALTTTGGLQLMGFGAYADYSSQSNPLVWIPATAVLHSTTQVALRQSDIITSSFIGATIPAGVGDSVTLNLTYPLI